VAKVKVKPKSWRYANTVHWTEAKRGVLTGEGKPDISVATPPDFGGHEGVWSPEDFFVAAVNCCIMTTFLYYQAKDSIDLVSYRSTAEGALEHGGEGLVFTTVKVKPEVVVASERDRKKAKQAMQRAETACLISKSVRTEVFVEARIQVAGDQRRASEA
jgi:organic hydroperoxide reductase OsmC/OhrA